MPHKGPHISISAEYVVNRILRINLDEFERWPQSVRQLAIDIAEELFLVAYNPFISASEVKKSVNEHYQAGVSFSRSSVRHGHQRRHHHVLECARGRAGILPRT